MIRRPRRHPRGRGRLFSGLWWYFRSPPPPLKSDELGEERQWRLPTPAHFETRDHIRRNGAHPQDAQRDQIPFRNIHVEVGAFSQHRGIDRQNQDRRAERPENVRRRQRPAIPPIPSPDKAKQNPSQQQIAERLADEPANGAPSYPRWIVRLRGKSVHIQLEFPFRTTCHVNASVAKSQPVTRNRIAGYAIP